MEPSNSVHLWTVSTLQYQRLSRNLSLFYIKMLAEINRYYQIASNVNRQSPIKCIDYQYIYSLLVIKKYILNSKMNTY